LFSRKLPAGEKSWAASLAAETDPRARKAMETLVAELDVLRADQYTADAFSSDQAATPEGNRPWRYRLDYTVTFAGAPESPASLFLTERLGGKTLVAGTADFGGAVFTVTQPMLDAIFALTYTLTQDPGPATPSPATEAPKL
jgi:hypothetical protein